MIGTTSTSLGRRISIMITILGICLLFVISIGFSLYKISDIDKVLHAKMQSTLKLAQTSLVSLVWHMDIQSANKVLDAIMTEKDVAYVAITIDDEVITKRARVENVSMYLKDFENSNDYFVGKVDITYLGREIGKLHVVLIRRDLIEDLYRESISLITISILVVAFISLMVNWILRRQIFIPLSLLEQQAERITRGDWNIQFDDRKDEIGVLGLALSKMVEELKGHIEHLDAKVHERTGELELTAKAAQTATLAKGYFLAAMSHEIRTPMNTILGMSELISKTDLTLEQRKFTNILSNSGEILFSLLNSILDFSRLESGEVDLEELPFDLLDLIESVLGVLSVQANEKEIELLYSIAPDVKIARIGDPVRLRQILINLLGNAVKFTQQGEVILEVWNDANDPELLRFWIKDTGIGIAADKLEKIFDSFSQADMSTTRNYGGTGLGLAITKRLVELMKGNIFATSQLNVGSEFTFTVSTPSIENRKLIGDKFRVFDLSGVNIILAHKSSTFRHFAKDVLDHTGAEVTLCSDSDHLCGKLQKGIPETGWQVVVLDNSIDEIDMFLTIRKIHRQNPGRIVPVIQISNQAFNEKNKQDAKRQEVKIIYKPVKYIELIKSIMESVKRQLPAIESEAELDPPVSTTLLRSLKILLVEDVAENQQLVTFFLRNQPVRLDIASNGLQGFELFAIGNYDLILMDLEMPVMDGFESARRIRRFEAENQREKTPIIALTAHVVDDQKPQCLEAGCTEFLSKPVRMDDLINKIAKITCVDS